jgi:hypothetical protein
MTSFRQIEANPRNARLSSGPVQSHAAGEPNSITASGREARK